MLGRARAVLLGKLSSGMKVGALTGSAGKFKRGIELAKGLFVSLKKFLAGDELGD